MAKLVAIGDSLTQGFQSLAISSTEQSYPAMIAECMGLTWSDFRIPDFRGAGGFPINMELLARELEDKCGYSGGVIKWISETFHIHEFMEGTEYYWEQGKGSQPCLDCDYHNLAFWGATVSDSYRLTAKECKDKISKNGQYNHNWFSCPSAAFYRSAYRVLNPAQLSYRDNDTQFSIAQRIAANENIEHLIVNLGANNCLGTVVKLKVCEDANLDRTIWSPSDFEKDYSELEREILKIKNKDSSKIKVYLATIPHVTIPPITRGIMGNRARLPNTDMYFDYYTYFWIHDKNFNPLKDNHLTKSEVIQIDNYINKYNDFIRMVAKRNNWNVVDICNILDNMAVRRNHGDVKYEIPSAISDLNTRLFEINKNGSIKNGGLFSLDGVHPTTCGYALMAQEFINAIKKTSKVSIKNVNFNKIRRWDTLVSNPPRTLDDMIEFLETLEKYIHVSNFFV